MGILGRRREKEEKEEEEEEMKKSWLLAILLVVCLASALNIQTSDQLMTMEAKVNGVDVTKQAVEFKEGNRFGLIYTPLLPVDVFSVQVIVKFEKGTEQVKPLVYKRILNSTTAIIYDYQDLMTKNPEWNWQEEQTGASEWTLTTSAGNKKHSKIDLDPTWYYADIFSTVDYSENVTNVGNMMYLDPEDFVIDNWFFPQIAGYENMSVGLHQDEMFLANLTVENGIHNTGRIHFTNKSNEYGKPIIGDDFNVDVAVCVMASRDTQPENYDKYWESNGLTTDTGANNQSLRTYISSQMISNANNNAYFTLGNYYSICGQYTTGNLDGGNGTMVFQSGVQRANMTGNASSGIINLDNIYFGRRPNGASSYNGYMNNIVVFNKSFTVAEIGQLHSGDLPMTKERGIANTTMQEINQSGIYDQVNITWSGILPYGTNVNVSLTLTENRSGTLYWKNTAYVPCEKECRFDVNTNTTSVGVNFELISNYGWYTPIIVNYSIYANESWKDTIPPEVINLTVNNTMNNTETESNVTVTDTTTIDTVIGNFTDPNGVTVTYPIPYTNRAGDLWNLSAIPTIVGNWTVRIIANDTSGNVNDTETFIVECYTDSVPPEIWNLTAPDINTGDNTTLAGQVSDHNLTLVLGRLVYPNGTHKWFSMDNTTNWYNYTWIANITAQDVGTYEFGIFAQDWMGNNNNATTEFEVTDNIPPNITLDLPVNDTWYNQSQAFTIEATAWDNVAISNTYAYVRINTGSYTPYLMTHVGGNTYRTTYTTTVIGNYSVYVLANDTTSLTNISANTSIIHVNDSTPPVISILRPYGLEYANMTIDIRVNISDDSNVTESWVNITHPYPSSEIQNLQLHPSGGGIWNTTWTNNAAEGVYTMTVHAWDSYGYEGTAVKSFKIREDRDPTGTEYTAIVIGLGIVLAFLAFLASKMTNEYVRIGLFYVALVFGAVILNMVITITEDIGASLAVQQTAGIAYYTNVMLIIVLSIYFVAGFAFRAVKMFNQLKSRRDEL